VQKITTIAKKNKKGKRSYLSFVKAMQFT